jgi:6,7-dimethyl-8-ribityllumazine synthase
MATAGKNLSGVDLDQLPDGSSMKIALVVSQWNREITGALEKGAYDLLLAAGLKKENILVYYCPGTFELPVTAQLVIHSHQPDAVVAIGNVIQGETRHFDFVCEAAAQGIKDVSLKTNIPVLFCVLTDNTLQQSIDRSGGIHGNKGIECAAAAVQMAALKKSLG